MEVLIDLRNRTLHDFLEGRISEEANRADLGAIAVEVDRLLSPDGQVPLEERSARVVAEILADSRARRAAVVPAKAARLEYWHRHLVERLRREDPQGYEAALREEAALDAAERDEVRMARPILAALRDRSIVSAARERVQAIAERPVPEVDPARPPPSPTWCGPMTIGSHGMSSSAACPARDAAVPSSAMRGASATASPGPRAGSAWSRSRQSSGRGIPITVRAGRLAVAHPTAGAAARHIPCPPTRSSVSTTS